MKQLQVRVSDCRTVCPICSHRRIKASYGQECAEIGTVRNSATRVADKWLQKEAELDELQSTRLTGIVLKTLSESITMSFKEKPAHKKDISLDRLQIRAAEICGPYWVHKLQHQLA